MHQTFGRYIQIFAQPFIVTQIELLVQKRCLQLPIELLQELTPRCKELGAIQVPLTQVRLLVQLLDLLQRTFDLLEPLIQHVLAHAHRQTGVAE
ncbi:hypothetical protein D9M71_799210 [compost metagenome]